MRAFLPTGSPFVGHSAGATLALSALQELRDRGGLLPAGAVALSPITNFTFSSESMASNRCPPAPTTGSPTSGE
ncbi:alpha/beta hydrolase fold domain-containing protein [Amycolatopsis sp. NPDC004169]|uniref:alpha/beta hydrolase n=1 Tax=Amycolatopsis sp. NPDC004169 TaxID=3154453 RepID=UPI0033B0753B